MKVGIPDGTNGTMVKNHVSITKFTELMILGQQTNNLIVVAISGCIKNPTYFPTNDSTSRPFRVLVAGSRVSETGDRSHESGRSADRRPRPSRDAVSRDVSAMWKRNAIGYLRLDAACMPIAKEAATGNTESSAPQTVINETLDQFIYCIQYSGSAVFQSYRGVDMVR